MKLSVFASQAAYLIPLVVLGLFASSCTPRQRIILSPGSQQPVPTSPNIESLGFTTYSSSNAVLDVATSVLATNNFTITLANDRLGLLQTDYLPLSTLLTTRVDTLTRGAALERLLLKITVHTEFREGAQYVQLTGAIQRFGRGTRADNLIGLYWLERLANDMAEGVGTAYFPQVTDEVYAAALAGNLELGPDPRGANASRQPNARTALLGVGAIFAVLAIVTLLGNLVAPGGRSN